MILSPGSKIFLLVTLIAVLNVEATPRRHPLIRTTTSSLVNDWRIVGGEENHGKPVPFMTSMLWNETFQCGGSILNERTIITAAHCVYKTKLNLIKFHVGDNTLTMKNGKVHKVEAIHIHPKYNDTNLENDIAIVRLKETLEYNERVQPLPLIEPGTVLKYGSIATVYGWGSTTDFGGPKSEILKFVRIPLVESEVCKRYMTKNSIFDSQLCAGDVKGGIDSCQGDSGGPLVQNGRLIGIVSTGGNSCAAVGEVGIYTHVQRMLPWIKQTLDREYGERL